MFDNQFDSHNIPHQNSAANSYGSESWEMDSLQKDDFELLSAFLDGEVTAAERQQVQSRLTSDAEMQRLYRRLLKLRQEFENISLPVITPSAADITQQVFAKVDRRRRLQFGLGIGGAIAALAVGAVSLNLSPTPSLQMVQQSTPQSKSELLMIAVNRPVIEIPINEAEPVSSPMKTN